jgi:hypothetical protein
LDGERELCATSRSKARKWMSAVATGMTILAVLLAREARRPDELQPWTAALQLDA